MGSQVASEESICFHSWNKSCDDEVIEMISENAVINLLRERMLWNQK